MTTPPCSEGVQWYVWSEPGDVSDTQVLDFMSAVSGGVTYKMNARPLQTSILGDIDVKELSGLDVGRLTRGKVELL